MKNNKNLSYILGEFLDEKMIDGVGEKKRQDYKLMGDQFIALLGDITPDKIDYNVIKKVKLSLISLPKRNIQKYKILPLKKYMKTKAAKEGDKITTASVNKKLALLKMLLKYYQEDMGNYDYNVPTIKAVKEKIKANKKRYKFNDEDVKKLITGDLLENKIARVIYYTGLRNSEIIKGELKKINDIFCISLLVEAELKTDAAYRVIPIHDAINEDIKTIIQYIKDNSVEAVGNRFNRYLRALGYSDKYVLYSLRHSFVNKLMNNKDIKDSVLKALVGHKQDDVTFGVYGKDFDITILKDAINTL